MSTVLVTGFGPYGVTPVNPAQLNADAVRAVDEVGPDLVIMLGEYGGRSMLTVERLAQNLNDCARYGLADTAGVVLDGEPTAPDGPVAYHATLPIKAMVLAMRDAGIPPDISDAAGTFVCNHLMYGMLHHIATHDLPIRAGWIHLPYLPEVAALDRNLGEPSMSVDTAAAGVMAGIEAALHHDVDVGTPVPSRLLI